MSNPNRPERTGKRFHLTLPQELSRQIVRAAAAGGTGPSSLIREILIGATPQIKAMADALEATRAGQVDGLTMISKMLRESVDGAEQVELDLKTAARAMRRIRK
jgi:hypothetical protein